MGMMRMENERERQDSQRKKVVRDMHIESIAMQMAKEREMQMREEYLGVHDWTDDEKSRALEEASRTGLDAIPDEHDLYLAEQYERESAEYYGSQRFSGIESRNSEAMGFAFEPSPFGQYSRK